MGLLIPLTNKTGWLGAYCRGSRINIVIEHGCNKLVDYLKKNKTISSGTFEIQTVIKNLIHQGHTILLTMSVPLTWGSVVTVTLKT